MTAHTLIVTGLVVAAELTIAITAGRYLHASRKRREHADQEAYLDACAEARADQVCAAANAGDRDALLIALGLIPDPDLADLPVHDACELQALIFPADITRSTR